jgi:hypothetical protein
MWPFDRRKKAQREDVPPEVQDYYQAEKRERTSVAWLLGFITLVITILLALIIFFGGRWAWRALTGNDRTDDDTSQVEQEPEDEVNGEDAEEPGDEAEEEDEEAPPPTPPRVPPAGPAEPEEPLPRTGPAAMAGTFIGTSVVGALVHYHLSRRKERD